MKSIVSNDALHNSLELANSKTPLSDLFKVSDNLNPRPSSRFFLTLSLGSSGYFLASAPGSPPPQEFKKVIENRKIKKIFIILKKVIVKFVVNLIIQYNILRYIKKIQ